ncbi:MAG: D-2-hydroxyacid dehydrogenase [Pirellulales bacterium]|nr:D-2-hydroxyacid dehydrogenase [Pirellulales bacterium]
MKIVVLDGHTLNSGDLSWETLEALGTCTVYPRTPAAETVARAEGAEIVLTNKTILGQAEIERLAALRYIGVLATGYNVVDVEAATERGITVTNVPAYGTDSVVQMVFAHLMNLTLHVGQHAQAVAEGRWSRSEDFCFWDYPLIELSDMTMGIVGLGRIGQAVARAASAFGMRVLAYDPLLGSGSAGDPPEGVEPVDLDRLFRESDVVTLHCPLTPDTERLVDERRLRQMKPTAYLINTGRGPLVDEAALAEALNANRLAGAGVDVLSTEPPPADNPLIGAKNCHITPHIAWATQAARRRLLDTAVKNIKAFLAGNPQNVVNR